MIFATTETYGRPEDAMPGFLLAFSIILIALWVAPANATEKLRVGKAVAFAWTFTPLDVGIQTGIFAKHGLEIEASDATGDAKLQQALTADSLDVGIGSGPRRGCRPSTPAAAWRRR